MNQQAWMEPVLPTKDHVRLAFRFLEETEDLPFRNIFFEQYMVKMTAWNINASAYTLAEEQYGLDLGQELQYHVANHIQKLFAKLEQKLCTPIKFEVKNVRIDPESIEVCIEMKGTATRLNGQPYVNDHVWLTKWNDEGKIIWVRYYSDTMLDQEVLKESSVDVDFLQGLDVAHSHEQDLQDLVDEMNF